MRTRKGSHPAPESMKPKHQELQSPVNIRNIGEAFSDAHTSLLSPRPSPTFWDKMRKRFWWPRSNSEGPQHTPSRVIHLKNDNTQYDYPRNVVVNHKYNLVTFLPMCLYEQFKHFFNLYFLLTAVSQCFPELAVGLWFSFVAPLAFVLILSLTKEAYDDIKRWQRDALMNSEMFTKLDPTTGDTVQIASASITVGTYLVLKSNQRVPADCVLLHTTEKNGASFIRTDQLDGETDWKLRFPVRKTQKCSTHKEIVAIHGALEVDGPGKEIYKFQGVAQVAAEGERIALDLSNTIWANCVLATGQCIGLVVYTGCETRTAMNSASPSAKRGLLDEELNTFSKYLFLITLIVALFMVSLQRFTGVWMLSLIRFIVLLSSIIPISMRVNLDMAKVLYCYFIMTDPKIDGVVVRNSSLPEELGRIWYLFSDKTGTLTRNEMDFRRLILGHDWKLDWDNREDIVHAVSTYFPPVPSSPAAATSKNPSRREIAGYSDEQLAVLGNCVLWISLCHNVTPVVDETSGERLYQGSSPDEVALVRFCENAGLTLVDRTLTSLTVETVHKTRLTYEIIKDFPFTSERKRMGIILREERSGRIVLLMKGADVVMQKIVRGADWLEESCTDLAREGLRTLVFGIRDMSEGELRAFMEELESAKTVMGSGRAVAVEHVMAGLESGLRLVGITGVEDKLQEDVQTSLETFGACNIRVWMLTGDKVETATCIARATHMFKKQMDVHIFQCKTAEDAVSELDGIEATLARQAMMAGSSGPAPYAIVVDGQSLEFFLENVEERFVRFAMAAGAVVVARCSPTQKADVVRSVRKFSPPDARTAAIGDGGNDVSMILAAHLGVGVEGKEGMHASLAGDFSIKQFSHVVRLFIWHGRNSYKRSCRQSQFVIHRGVLISMIQIIFSFCFNYVSVSVYSSWLLVGYATVYTMLPVFCIVLDEDTKEEYVVQFPPLYAQLQKGRSLNLRTFLTWVWISFYQGGVIMCLGLYMFQNDMYKVVAISFTSLILNELLTVCFDMHFRILWRQRPQHLKLFIITEFVSIGVYLFSLFVMNALKFNLGFDVNVLMQLDFWWNVLLVSLTSVMPVVLLRELWPGKSMVATAHQEPGLVSLSWRKFRRWMTQ